MQITKETKTTKRPAQKPRVIRFVDLPGMDHGKMWSWELLDYRAPKKGEHYLSGAIVEAYTAKNDMQCEYFIVRKLIEHRPRQVWVPVGATKGDLVHAEFMHDLAD